MSNLENIRATCDKDLEFLMSKNMPSDELLGKIGYFCSKKQVKEAVVVMKLIEGTSDSEKPRYRTEIYTSHEEINRLYGKK